MLFGWHRDGRSHTLLPMITIGRLPRLPLHHVQEVFKGGVPHKDQVLPVIISDERTISLKVQEDLAPSVTNQSGRSLAIPLVFSFPFITAISQ